jgi:hypothetical protein
MSETDTRSPRHYRAKLANARRRGDHAAAERAARDLRTANLEKAIRAIVDAAPPLTSEQRTRLAELLTSGPGEATAP